MGHLQILLTLASKRAHIERAVKQYQKRLEAAKRDLEHVVGTMALFEASGDLKAIGAHHAIVRMFRRGEMFTAIKAALEASSCALDTRELAAVVLRAKGLDDGDAVMRKAVTYANVQLMRKRELSGQVRAVGTRDRALLWRLPVAVEIDWKRVTPGAGLLF